MARRQALVGLALTIALGATSRRFPVGLLVWDKSLGDALYTVMVYFAVAFSWPALRPSRVALAALAISIAIELFQLTGVPLRLPALLQVALGTAFAWHDVACYAVGAVGALMLHLRQNSRTE